MLNKLSKIIAFIKTSNIVLNVPKKSSYLIYDFHERFDLKPLNIYNFTKLNLKTEINLWVLLNCFFNLFGDIGLICRNIQFWRAAVYFEFVPSNRRF